MNMNNERGKREIPTVCLKKPPKETPIREYTPEHIREEYIPYTDAPIREINSEHLKEEFTPQIEVKKDNLPVTTTETPPALKKKGIKAKIISLLGKFYIDFELIVAIIVVLVFALTFAFFVSDASTQSKALNAQNQAIDAVRGGTIVDKEIINPHSTVFHDFPAEYRIYVNCEYEYEGEKKTARKYFAVPESVYLAYDIGDYFNSQNY